MNQKRTAAAADIIGRSPIFCGDSRAKKKGARGLQSSLDLIMFHLIFFSPLKIYA